jgi:hypothetical protein
MPPICIAWRSRREEPLRVIFNDLGASSALPVNPNDRKGRTRSGASASGPTTDSRVAAKNQPFNNLVDSHKQGWPHREL